MRWRRRNFYHGTPMVIAAALLTVSAAIAVYAVLLWFGAPSV
jgi:hypothetical protein